MPTTQLVSVDCIICQILLQSSHLKSQGIVSDDCSGDTITLEHLTRTSTERIEVKIPFIIARKEIV